MKNLVSVCFVLVSAHFVGPLLAANPEKGVVTYDSGCISPDGKYLVVKVDKGLRLLNIPAASNSVVTLPVGYEPAPFTGNARLWNPKATQFVFACFNQEGTAASIWLYDLQKGSCRVLHKSFLNNGSRTCPTWSPDGQKVAYFLQSSDSAFEAIAYLDIANQRESIALPSKVDTVYAWPLIWSARSSSLYVAEMKGQRIQSIDIESRNANSVLTLSSLLASLTSPVRVKPKMLNITGVTEKNELILTINYGVASLLAWPLDASAVQPVSPCPNGQVSPDGQRVLYVRQQAERKAVFLYHRKTGISYIVENDVEMDCDRPIWRDNEHMIYRRRAMEIWQKSFADDTKCQIYPSTSTP